MTMRGMGVNFSCSNSFPLAHTKLETFSLDILQDRLDLHIYGLFVMDNTIIHSVRI